MNRPPPSAGITARRPHCIPQTIKAIGMTCLPRFALGTVRSGCCGRLMLWALLESLSRRGISTQLFHSRACFPRNDGAMAITGLRPRHLDSWLMRPDLCREFFRHGSRCGELSLVEGFFQPADQATAGRRHGGGLSALCDWLDLPRLVIIDASQLGLCRLPPRPANVDGLLLDRLSGREDFFRQQTTLQSLWGIPVLGGLPEAPALREAARHLAPGDEPPRKLIDALGDLLAANIRIDRIRQIAESRPAEPKQSRPAEPKQQSRPVEPTRHVRHDRPMLHPRCCRNIRVAVAFDEAFHDYFPDTLDLLETIGAEVVDFSPLHDESLPPSIDLVYFGGGHPERFAAELSSNHCMTMALQCHLHQGRRMYAEGGGLAYLCRYLELPSGELVPMIGALPAVARRNAMPQTPQPLTATLRRDSWLGKQGSQIRGYLNSAWIIEPVGQLSSLAAEPQRQYDLVEHRGTIGSRIHVNFAAQSELLRHLSLVGRPPTDRPGSMGSEAQIRLSDR